MGVEEPMSDEKIRAQLAQVREWLQQGQYEQARALLEKLDHPKREEWLNKVAERQRAAQSQPATAAIPAKPNPPADTTETWVDTVLRVLVGSLIAFIVVTILMLLADQAFEIHEYALRDGVRRENFIIAGVVGVGTIVFAFITRAFMGSTANLIIAFYLIILTLIRLPLTHYLSFYFTWGVPQGLTAPFSQEALTAYGAFLNTLAADLLFIGYGGGLAISLITVFMFGAASDQELKKYLEK
jgi:hypothetical protein